LKGEQWADRVALPLLATAGATLAVLGPVPSSIVLASGIGNRVRLFGPLATLTYLDLASGSGFLIKDGRALEQLRGVDTVLFDKTGTLTRNWFVVNSVVTCGAWTERDLIAYAALAEGRETHPIARGVLARAAELGIAPAGVDSRRYHFGFGIAVEHGGHRVDVGSARFMRREHIALEPLGAVIRHAEEKGHPLVFVAVDGELAGAIELEAAVRPDLPDMIAGLRRRGVTLTAIVSGDHNGAAAATARELGVDRALADLTPAGKAEVVEQLQREGRRVCFIGDGVNDAVAMARADVSISLHGASSFALDAAQIVLMDADRGLASLDVLFDMAKALDRNLKNSLGIAIATAAVNVNAALLVQGYGVLTAYAVKQTGLAAGLGNAMLLPRVSAAAHNVRRTVTAKLA
jgi:Cu2+-exporting ATPase